MKPNKYYNRKTKTADGAIHASAKEARRWAELCILQRAGKISNLRRQVRFELIPAQYEDTPKGKRCAERRVDYVADFVYADEHGKEIVEDTKGFRTPEYVIKRKCMRYLKGIVITEI